MEKCQHCGLIHGATCPLIAAIEYYPDGSVKRIEFRSNVSTVVGGYVAEPGVSIVDVSCVPNPNVDRKGLDDKQRQLADALYPRQI